MDSLEIGRCTGLKQEVVDQVVAKHQGDTRTALASIVQTIGTRPKEKENADIWDDPEALENDMNQIKINGVLFETYRRVQEVDKHIGSGTTSTASWALLRKHDWTPSIAKVMFDHHREQMASHTKSEGANGSQHEVASAPLMSATTKVCGWASAKGKNSSATTTTDAKLGNWQVGSTEGSNNPLANAPPPPPAVGFAQTALPAPSFPSSGFGTNCAPRGVAAGGFARFSEPDPNTQMRSSHGPNSANRGSRNSNPPLQLFEARIGASPLIDVEIRAPEAVGQDDEEMEEETTGHDIKKFYFRRTLQPGDVKTHENRLPDLNITGGKSKPIFQLNNKDTIHEWLSVWSEPWTSQSARRVFVDDRTPEGEDPDSSTVNQSLDLAHYLALHDAHGRCWIRLFSHFPRDVAVVIFFYRCIHLRFNSWIGIRENSQAMYAAFAGDLRPLSFEHWRDLQPGPDTRGFTDRFASVDWVPFMRGAVAQGQTDLLTLLLQRFSHYLEGSFMDELVQKAVECDQVRVVKLLLTRDLSPEAPIRHDVSRISACLLPRVSSRGMAAALILHAKSEEARGGHQLRLRVALLRATISGYVEVAQELVNAGAPFKKPLDTEETDTIEVQPATSFGRRSHFVPVRYDPILIVSLQSRNKLKMLQFWLGQEGVDLGESFPGSDDLPAGTVLTIAISQSSVSSGVIRALVEAGADLNCTDHNPLVSALLSGAKLSTVTLLLDLGAKIHLGGQGVKSSPEQRLQVPDTEDNSYAEHKILDAAALFSTPDVCDLLLDRGADPTLCSLEAAKQSGSLRLLEAVLAAQPFIPCVPLVGSRWHSQPAGGSAADATRMLLAAGCDPQCKSMVDGSSCLLLRPPVGLSMEAHLEVIKVLHKAGASLDGGIGEVLLHRAVVAESAEQVKFFLDAGVDPDQHPAIAKLKTSSTFGGWRDSKSDKTAREVALGSRNNAIRQMLVPTGIPGFQWSKNKK